MATHMALMPRSLKNIASRAGVDEAEAEKILEAMAEKAVIFSKEKDGRKSYGLLPTIPGLFEFPLMRGAGTPELEGLGKLWDDYHREALGASFSGNPTPLVRVIPVEQSLEGLTRVHPHEEVARLIDAVDYIALAGCACRISIKACGHPTEMCLIFDGPARFLTARGFAREITRDEAHAVLTKAEEAGLVHTSNNSKDRPSIICNCCRCCCTILTCRTQLGLPHAFAESAYQASIDAQSCTGCGLCAEGRCPMEAITLSGASAEVDAGKCIGCGLCVSSCPEGAIALANRAEPREVLPTVQDLGMKVLTEKGRLERFLNQMK
ncbi:MAG TPA: 4Fe-4S binding protein [Deltaproteobacteria bacterium]|nr:4Fe-4S binding protein [Deltaproteobacteria bacterium]HOI06965.1 4Fe-4S binding protein [Deltaproteobacteria bacterium]